MMEWVRVMKQACRSIVRQQLEQQLFTVHIAVSSLELTAINHIQFIADSEKLIIKEHFLNLYTEYVDFCTH